MAPQSLLDLAFKRAEERRKMENSIRQLWETSLLHITQLHKMSGVGYQRLRSFLTLRGSANTLTDAELVAIHTTLSR